MILVKLVELGRQTQEFPLENGASVSDLFDAADRPMDGSITINGQSVSSYTVLRDRDMVFVGNRVKGNVPFEAKFIRFGGNPSLVGVMVEDGYTVEQAVSGMNADIKAQFIGPQGKHSYEYRIGGTQLVEANAVIPRPSQGTEVRIICSQRMKGNAITRAIGAILVAAFYRKA